MTEHELHHSASPVRRRRRRRVLQGAAGLALVSGSAAGGLFALQASGAATPKAIATAKVTSTRTSNKHRAHLFAPRGAPPAVAGTVASVDATGDSFTVTDRSGSTITVAVSSSTTYMDPSVSSAGISNVTVGEHVAVVGTTTSGTVTATQVLIGTPGGPGGAFAPQGAAAPRWGGVPPAA